MEALLCTLQTNALESYHRNAHDKQVLQQQRDQRMRDAIQSAFDTISEQTNEQMIAASSLGNFGCVIFECQGSDQFNEEFKYVYLLKGPLRWNGSMTFFETKNTESLLTKLKNHFSPIHIYMKYDRYTKKHLIIASWKTTT